jgi:zinc transporter ZupT
MNASWVQVGLATAIASMGALAATLLGQAASRLIRPLVYVALLFFALAAVFDILPESKQALSWPIFLSAVGAGYAVFWLVGKYVAPICPACAMRHFEEGDHAHGSGLVFVALVLGGHCFLDGLGVSAATRVEAAFGLRVFVAIAVHKLPEGFALGMVLMAGGWPAWRALAWAIVIEAATLGGALAGVWWMHLSEFWLALILAHIGGTFLYLSAGGLQDALAPRTHRAGVDPPTFASREQIRSPGLSCSHGPHPRRT